MAANGLFGRGLSTMVIGLGFLFIVFQTTTAQDPPPSKVKPLTDGQKDIVLNVHYDKPPAFCDAWTEAVGTEADVAKQLQLFMKAHRAEAAAAGDKIQPMHTTCCPAGAPAPDCADYTTAGAEVKLSYKATVDVTTGGPTGPEATTESSGMAIGFSEYWKEKLTLMLLLVVKLSF